MDDSSKPSAFPPAEAKSVRRDSVPGAIWRRLTFMAVGFVVGGGLAWWLLQRSVSNAPGAPAATAAPLSGKFIVYVRPPERESEPQPVEKPGATPVRAGGNMSLEVQLDPPGYVYCVWLDAAGQVVPLYPWNSQHLEVTDIHDLPPERRAAKLVYSPLLGGGWNFGETTGAETVLFLARQTPLPPAIQLADLLTPLPPAPGASPQVVVLALDASATDVALIHPPVEIGSASAEAEPLKSLLLRLQPHFDLIRAVRFPHE